MSDKHQRRPEQKAQQARVKAQINRDKARRKLLQQREKLAQRRKRNRKQSEARRADTDDEDGVENPTAHSTIPPQKTNAENAARNSHSTVPRTPKYSEMAGRERLYGQRLHQQTTSETAESAGASDATTAPSDRDADEDQTNE